MNRAAAQDWEEAASRPPEYPRQRPVGWHLIWLLSELVLAWGLFLWLWVRRGFRPTARDRSLWLQIHARRVLRVMGGAVRVEGAVPSSGMLVCNHLSYVDILVLAATAQCVFVSKREVRRWPLFGYFAAAGGTLFVDRKRKRDVARLNAELARRLEQGLLVVLFPEGTSSSGRSVLPFRSSLLECARGSRHPLQVAALDYALAAGDVETDVCWWGDMTLTGHLPRLLSRPGLVATVRFRPFEGDRSDRKRLAGELRDLVSSLRAVPGAWRSGSAPGLAPQAAGETLHAG